MTSTPPRRRAASRRPTAPIGSRPPGPRRRISVLPPSASRQPAADGPADWWTRVQQAAGTLAALGALAAFGFTWLSIQQVENEQALTRDEHALTREGQVNERYNNAVGNIGDDSPEVRLSGIYSLQRIMEEAPREQPSIVDALSAYVRRHAKKPQGGIDDHRKLASDVQAALTVLGNRAPAHDGSARVDLRGAHLAGARLFDADLFDADLTGADLRGADLFSANLAAADLAAADLQGANLAAADLSAADLSGADLRDADLTGADQIHEHVPGADLADADLARADLRDADLREANLTRANLEGADVRGADLSYTRLRGARLADTGLGGAKLTGAER